MLSRDALYNPDDERAPFGLLFNTRTWTPVEPEPAPRFRGFTYKVPRLLPVGSSSPDNNTT